MIAHDSISYPVAGVIEKHGLRHDREAVEAIYALADVVAATYWGRDHHAKEFDPRPHLLALGAKKYDAIIADICDNLRRSIDWCKAQV